MNSKGQKLISLILIFSLLILPMTLTAKERRGADLVIYKTDGNQAQGELIAVKQNSLLLKEQGSGADVTAVFSDIKTIKIVKKSKAGKGALYGFGLAATGGALYHLLLYELTEPETRLGVTLSGGVLVGVMGALAGLIVGEFLGMDKTIQIEGKSDSEIKELLEDLRKKARVPNFQ